METNISLPLQPSAAKAIREASKQLFGNKHFLEAAVALAQAADRRAYVREIAQRTGIPDASLRAPFQRMADLKILHALGDSKGALPLIYERRESGLWDFAPVMLSELLARLEAGQDRDLLSSPVDR